MKAFLTVFLLIAASLTSFSQTEKPPYKEVTDRFTKFYNNNQSDSIFNLFSVEMKTALPIERTREMVSQLKVQLGNVQSREFVNYQATAAIYKTTFEKALLSLVISIDKNNKVNGLFFRPYIEEKNTTGPSASNLPIKLKTPEGDLSGTLAMPKTGIKFPVVLIIAGSGPTDRNGNQLLAKNNSLKFLAEGLKDAGIASVRYDKRGVGESSSALKNEADLRFNDFVEDAAGFIRLLKADGRFSKVIVLGHSEGSLIGMLAAGQENVDAFISVAGAADTADKLLEEQLKAQPEEFRKVALPVLNSLKNGRLTENVDPKLFALFRRGVQPYLISWFKYDPKTEIQKLKMPVLIVQGNTDIQVSVQNAEKLKKAKPGAELKIIDQMNHVLKQAPVDRQLNTATYTNPGLPVKTELVQSITGFIKDLK